MVANGHLAYNSLSLSLSLSLALSFSLSLSISLLCFLTFPYPKLPFHTAGSGINRTTCSHLSNSLRCAVTVPAGEPNRPLGGTGCYEGNNSHVCSRVHSSPPSVLGARSNQSMAFCTSLKKYFDISILPPPQDFFCLH